jgi:hypothetical protein
MSGRTTATYTTLSVPDGKMQPTGPHPADIWPVLLLLGAKKPPVAYTWLAARVAEGIRRGSKVAAAKGEAVALFDRAAGRRHLDDVLQRLESLGVVAIQRPAGVTASVIPLPRAFHRAWWSQVVVRVLAQLGKPTEAAKKIAVVAGVEDRSAWRWLGGQTTPGTDHMALVVRKLLTPETKRVLIEMLTVMVMHSLAQAENCGLTPTEKRRSERFFRAELQPLADLIETLAHDKGAGR